MDSHNLPLQEIAFTESFLCLYFMNELRLTKTQKQRT